MPVETCELNYLDFDNNQDMYNKRRELKREGWKVTLNTKKKVTLERAVPEPAKKPAARRSRRR